MWGRMQKGYKDGFKVVKDFKEIAFSRLNEADAHTNSQSVCQSAQDLHRFKPEEIHAWRK